MLAVPTDTNHDVTTSISDEDLRRFEEGAHRDRPQPVSQPDLRARHFAFGDALWLPLSHTVLRGKRMTASQYAAREGGLFKVERDGKPPLLLSRRTKEPVFVGIEQVHLRKRFDLRGTIDSVARRVPEFWADQHGKTFRGK